MLGLTDPVRETREELELRDAKPLEICDIGGGSAKGGLSVEGVWGTELLPPFVVEDDEGPETAIRPSGTWYTILGPCRTSNTA